MTDKSKEAEGNAKLAAIRSFITLAIGHDRPLSGRKMIDDMVWLSDILAEADREMVFALNERDMARNMRDNTQQHIEQHRDDAGQWRLLYTEARDKLTAASAAKDERAALHRGIVAQRDELIGELISERNVLTITLAKESGTPIIAPPWVVSEHKPSARWADLDGDVSCWSKCDGCEGSGTGAVACDCDDCGDCSCEEDDCMDCDGDGGKFISKTWSTLKDSDIWAPASYESVGKWGIDSDAGCLEYTHEDIKKYRVRAANAVR